MKKDSKFGNFAVVEAGKGRNDAEMQEYPFDGPGDPVINPQILFLLVPIRQQQTKRLWQSDSFIPSTFCFPTTTCCRHSTFDDMQLTFLTDLGQSFVVEIDENMELENVMALLEAEV